MGKIMTLMKHLVPGIAGAITFFGAPAARGWGSVGNALHEKNYKEAGYAAVRSLTGVDIKNSTADVAGIINPLELQEAPTPKVILWTRSSIEIIDAVGKLIRGALSDITKEAS
jgi:hypothetical protein